MRVDKSYTCTHLRVRLAVGPSLHHPVFCHSFDKLYLRESRRKRHAKETSDHPMRPRPSRPYPATEIPGDEALESEGGRCWEIPV